MAAMLVFFLNYTIRKEDNNQKYQFSLELEYILKVKYIRANYNIFQTFIKQIISAAISE